MEHTLAHETYAAERYLLGEMAPEERDQFEEHFFGCQVCGENVQAASVFLENTKSVFLDESRKASSAAAKRVTPPRDWIGRRWLAGLRLPVAVPSFAALALAAFVGYQNMVVIPQLETPQSMASPVILDGETRAAVLPKATEGAPLRFQMVLGRTVPSPAGTSDRVLVDLMDAAGKIVRSGSVEAPGISSPLDVYFPGRLKPGRYTLLARSDRGSDAGLELARSQFEIVSK